MAVQHPAAALHAVATKLDALDELLADPWTAWNRMDPFARSMLHNDNVRQWCDEVRKERERLRDERTALVKMHALVMESEMRSTTAQLHPGTRARTSAQVSDEPSASDSTAVDESNVNFGEEIGSAELYESSAMMCARRKPYVKGELILVVVKRAARQQGFHATMYSVGEKSVPPFCAISHAWLESSITDPEDFDNEGMMWKVQHDPRAAEQLAATLLSLTANNRAATLWIDFLCLPQALEFSRHPEIFSSMSRVYSQCVKCVAIPTCFIEGADWWDGTFQTLDKNVTEIEQHLNDKMYVENAPKDVFDPVHAGELKTLVDKIRPSHVSEGGWRGLGFMPYVFMRNATLALYVANTVLKSDYFARVWPFQEIMLPRELSVSIAVGPEKPSSIVDIDHLLQCAFRAIEVIRPITRASTSESVLLGPAYTAYTSSTVQVSRELLDTYQWLVQGRKLGRDYRERVLSGALDVNYAVRLFEVYTQVPRKCKFAVDYVNGLRGLLPVDTTILLASTNPVTVVEDLMEALKVATGRLWATGGFIKVGQLERLWWTTSIPKVMNSSLFLQGTSHSGFYSTKERREIPGVVVDATELEILGFAGLKTKVADRENGEVVYSFKRRTCGIHEPTDMTGSGSRRDATRRMDSEELSAVGVLGFLQSVLLRLGHEGSDFHEGVDQLISLRLSGGEEETSTLRREIRHCLRTMGNTRESLIFQNPITTGNVDIKFTSTELMELFQLTRPDLDVMVEMMPSCGCRFAMPHVLVQNLARRWLGDKGYLLNLSAITPLNEVLDISICKVVQKIPMLDKLMGTADKGTPTSTTSSSRRTGEAERRAKVYYTSAFDLASNKELFGELLGDVGKVLDDAFCMSVKGIMFSLRDSLDTHGIPEFYDKVRMYERTANVYTVFATHKDGEYDTDTRQLERRAIGNFVKLKGELMVRKSKV